MFVIFDTIKCNVNNILKNNKQLFQLNVCIQHRHVCYSIYISVYAFDHTIFLQLKLVSYMKNFVTVFMHGMANKYREFNIHCGLFNFYGRLKVLIGQQNMQKC